MVLVPEIALTPSDAAPVLQPTFKTRWRCSTAALTPAQRYDEYRRVRDGQSPGGAGHPQRRIRPAALTSA